MAKQSIQIEVPEGWEATGEYRPFRAGEWFLDSLGKAQQGGDVYSGAWPILRPVAPKFKAGDYLVHVATKRVWLLTQHRGDGDCVASDGETGLIGTVLDHKYFTRWTPSLNTPVGHNAKSIELGPVEQIDGERYKVIGRWFTLDELCPVEFCRTRFPMYVTSTSPDWAFIVYHSADSRECVMCDGSRRSVEMCLTYGEIALDIIRGGRFILTESEALARVKPKLLPCPFCDSRDQRIYSDDCEGKSPRMWSVACHGCNADGPERNTEADAIRLWNTRGGAK